MVGFPFGQQTPAFPLSEDDKRMALIQGLLSGGGALMQAGGPSTSPVSAGQALGAGIGQATNTFMGAQKQAQQNKYMAAQTGVLTAQAAAEQRKQEAQARVAAFFQAQQDGSAPPPMPLGEPGAQNAAFGPMAPPKQGGAPFPLADMIAADPSFASNYFMQSMKPGAKPGRHVVAGSLVDDDGKPLYTAPEKPPTPTDDQKEYDSAKAQGYTGTLQDWIIDQRKASASRTEVRMPPQESAYDTTVGKYYGDKFASMQESGMKASGGIARMERLDQLLDQVNTGAFTGTIQEFKKAAKTLNIDLDSMGIRDDVAPAEAAVALASEMALEMRNPAGGAGMPGAMSDGDREMLKSMGPNLGQTTEGRKLLIDARKRVYQREQQVARMARDYEKRNKRLDAGFFDELAAWSEKNPIFSNEDMNRAEKARLPQLTQEQYNTAPSGTRFVAPDGKIRTKP